MPKVTCFFVAVTPFLKKGHSFFDISDSRAAETINPVIAQKSFFKRRLQASRKLAAGLALS